MVMKVKEEKGRNSFSKTSLNEKLEAHEDLEKKGVLSLFFY